MSAAPPPRPMAGSRIGRWLAARPDGSLLAWVFRGTIAATAIVLALDFADLRASDPRAGETGESWSEPLTRHLAPLLPGEEAREGTAPAPPVDLANPASFDLRADGRLMMSGTIDPGSAERFAAELDKRGSYVETVVLSSPGGSVTDALAIGRMIRERGLDTEVEAGSHCASSCPLIFAAGIERTVHETASIGVHQVFAVGDTGLSASQGMDSAQRASAECQRYLMEMGVDLRVWMHAMETPAARLYHFSTDELVEFDLATALRPAAG